MESNVEISCCYQFGTDSITGLPHTPIKDTLTIYELDDDQKLGKVIGRLLKEGVDYNITGHGRYIVINKKSSCLSKEKIAIFKYVDGNAKKLLIKAEDVDSNKFDIAFSIEDKDIKSKN